MKGSDGKSLEHTLLELLHKVRELEEEAKKDKKEMTLIKEHVRSLVRTPEILRFKADGGASSNQSFSLALLDSEGNGTALTTLHVRDRVSFYGKNIKKWTGDTELTDEEKEVIERVKKNEK